MRPLDFPLLLDENIHPDVSRALAARGKDIRTVGEEGLGGADDLDILRRARFLGRVVVTHDGDFGTLAYRTGETIVGIIYLRPGHLSASFVLGTISAVEQSDLDVAPPFLLVAERRADVVRVRVRRAAEHA